MGRLAALKDNKLNQLGYWNKPIMRIGTLICVILVLFVGFTDGFATKINAHCDSENKCFNPLYRCKVGESSTKDMCQDKYINKDHERLCAEGHCERYLNPGEKIGDELNFVSKNLFWFLMVVFLSMLVANQIAYQIKVYKENERKQQG